MITEENFNMDMNTSLPMSQKVWFNQSPYKEVTSLSVRISHLEHRLDPRRRGLNSFSRSACMRGNRKFSSKSEVHKVPILCHWSGSILIQFLQELIWFDYLYAGAYLISQITLKYVIHFHSLRLNISEEFKRSGLSRASTIPTNCHPTLWIPVQFEPMFCYHCPIGNPLGPHHPHHHSQGLSGVPPLSLYSPSASCKYTHLLGFIPDIRSWDNRLTRMFYN